MKYFYLIIFILFTNCSLNNPVEKSGVVNLRIKINEIKINETNKNDVSKLIGPPIIIDSFDKNIWTFVETIKKSNIFGKKVLVLNDVLILKFNNLGIVSDYETYDINSIKDVEFSKIITKNDTRSGLIDNILASSKKRVEMLQKNRN